MPPHCSQRTRKWRPCASDEGACTLSSLARRASALEWKNGDGCARVRRRPNCTSTTGGRELASLCVCSHEASLPLAGLSIAINTCWLRRNATLQCVIHVVVPCFVLVNLMLCDVLSLLVASSPTIRLPHHRTSHATTRPPRGAVCHEVERALPDQRSD